MKSQKDTMNFVAKSLSVAVSWLLGMLPVGAAVPTPYTSTGWITAVPVPSIVWTNDLQQVLFRGNAQTVRVESSDPRLTGRRVVFVDGAYQADGTALLNGVAYQEVGNWDMADPASPKFTASGGVWEFWYRGRMQTDNSLQLHLVGRGSGGSIEGLRLDEDLTRTAGAILDPALPYLYTGTIQAPPLSTQVVLDNFDDGILSGSSFGSGGYTERQGQLSVVGNFVGIRTTGILDSYAFRGPTLARVIPNGQTLEWHADLVSLDGNTTNTAILAVGSNDALYALHKGSGFVYLLKYTSSRGVSIFSCDTVSTPNTNVILSLAVTRAQPNLLLTARVLDRSDPAKILYQHSVLDTPSSDPTLTKSQFQQLTGMGLDIVPEQPAVSPSSFSVTIGLFQYTDGMQPAPTAVFDNLGLRTFEIPPVSIAGAVRLTWPTASDLRYAAEGAPTIQGPWLPVGPAELPGLDQTVAPIHDAMKFFRLRQAP